MGRAPGRLALAPNLSAATTVMNCAELALGRDVSAEGVLDGLGEGRRGVEAVGRIEGERAAADGVERLGDLRGDIGSER